LKWKFEFTGPNQILEFILYKYLNKNWKFTGPNKVLLVLARGPVLIMRTDQLLENKLFTHKAWGANLKFIDQPCCDIVTGDLNIVKDKEC
jgi:hypothetical protein